MSGSGLIKEYLGAARTLLGTGPAVGACCIAFAAQPAPRPDRLIVGMITDSRLAAWRPG